MRMKTKKLVKQVTFILFASVLIYLFLQLLLVKISPMYDLKKQILNQSVSINIPTKQTVDNMHKLVHIDLKGAPPVPEYFKQLIPYLKHIGATGLLIEYEDMFPYEDGLKFIRNQNAYSKIQLAEILSLAKEQGLIIIPLIQTYGHLEFVLKFNKFKYLREIEKHFQVITPCIQDTYEKVLYPMIDQIIDFHKKYDLKYIHIGGDEVHFIGNHSSCLSKSPENHYIDHFKKLVEYINSVKKSLKVIIWDDILRRIAESKNVRLAELKIEPMICYYEDNFKMNDKVFDSYSKYFKKVWIASSFKGQTFNLAILPNMTKHYLNHLGWLKQIEKLNRKMKFVGIALTGWSRYDHMQGICELLPTATPSLVLCLQTIINYGDFQTIVNKANEYIECIDLTNVLGFYIYKLEETLPALTDGCIFPASDVFLSLLKVKIEIDYILEEHKFFSSVLNDYNLDKGYVNSMVLDSSHKFYYYAKKQLINAMGKITTTLKRYFYPDVAVEFIGLYIKPHFKSISEMNEKLKKFRYKHVYARPYMK